MPNLVGIGNTQVPTNGMLGGLAYQNPTNANLDSVEIKNISKMQAVINRNAVGVFVYDTRKDTDGGAWRHKCTDKSWYKEPLNTNIRGSRREFPAVAILVSLANTGSTSGIDFIIYDGDDPNCPMWMVCSFNVSNGTNGSIHACNGIIAQATTSNGSPYYDFLLDRIRYHNHAHRHTAAWIYPSRKGPDYKQWSELNMTGATLPNENGTEVYCKVMPDAVDYEGRGLLMPDILFSQTSGMGHLKSNGTMYTHEYNTFNHRFSKFLSNNHIITAMDNNYYGKWINVYPPLTANRTTDYGGSTTCVYVNYNAQDQFRLVVTHVTTDENKPLHDIEVTDNTDDVFFASDKGMGFATIETNHPEGSGYARMVNFVTKDFATGYMIQRMSTAVLCGTQKKYNFNYARIYSTYGSGLRSANYTVEYSDDNSNWSVAFGGVMSNNTATGLQMGTRTTNNNITTKHRYWRYVVGSAVDGHHPRVSRIELGEGSPLTTYHIIHQPATDNTSDTGNIPSGSNNTVKVDSYLLGATNDRTVYNRGYNLTNNLNNSGQLTATPVATGSDLLGYSGWSSTAFLQQQYHHGGFDLGDGGLTIAFWAKLDISTTGYILDHQASSGSGARFAVYYQDSQVKFYTSNGTSSTEVVTPSPGNGNPPGLDNIMDNVWHQVVITREPASSNANSAHRIYVNGIRRLNVSTTLRTLTNTSARMTVGIRYDSVSNPFNGHIALLRLSQDPASEQQVHKMYLREKQLFTENAKCTLTAEDSDRVFDLAYDTSTGSLHATNETGRDEFRGLVRLNNEGGQGPTTIDISASNGIVAAE